MTEREAVAAVTGMMEDVKRAAGPALGMVKKWWPQAGGMQRLLRDMYADAKFIQDQTEKL